MKNWQVIFNEGVRRAGRSLSIAALPHCLVASCLLVVAAVPAFAQPSRPLMVPPPGRAATDRVPILREVGVDQKLDQQIPLDLTFTDSTGKDVKLAEYFTK